LKYVFFTSYVHSQKSEFRQNLLIQKNEATYSMVFLEEELYRNTKGVEWKEDNKEIVVNGVYHEVLSVVRQNNTYVVTLIPDKAENKLFKSFFNTKQQDESNTLNFLSSFIALTFLNEEALKLKLITTVNERQYFDNQSSPLFVFMHKKIKPPQFI